MRRVILESPYAGKTPEDVAANVDYARACVRDCLLRDEAPLASHLLYTQPGILRDGVAEERALGMRAGLSWTPLAEAVVVYVDRGVTPGMQAGIARAKKNEIPVVMRSLNDAGDLTQPLITPTQLHDLLVSIGHDVPVEALVETALTDADVKDAFAWAKAKHADAQGAGVEVPSCPRWLEPLLTRGW